MYPENEENALYAIEVGKLPGPTKKWAINVLSVREVFLSNVH